MEWCFLARAFKRAYRNFSVNFPFFSTAVFAIWLCRLHDSVCIFSPESNMDASSLRKKYRSTYEDFFQKNELVFSIPYSFSFGNVAIRYESDTLHARSSIRQRLYVGLTFSSKL